MDPKTLMSILNTSTGRCWSSEMYNPVPGMVPNCPSSNGYKASSIFFIFLNKINHEEICFGKKTLLLILNYFFFFQGGFGVSLIAKDLGIAQSVATQSGIAIPMGGQAGQLYRMMEIKKMGDKDMAVAYQFLKGESA